MSLSFVKGDSITLEATLDEDITNWKIRVEFFDNCGHEIKLATSNSGGSSDQISITDSSNGKFTIFVQEGKTTNFENQSDMEIEVETTNTVGGKPEILTIFKQEIEFKDQEIDWSTP